MNREHEAWMDLALDEARAALATDDVPIGAVVISPDGKLLSTGRNEREALKDPTAHAEVVAIRNAVSALAARGADDGGVSERPKVQHSKCCVGQPPTVGSNPTATARRVVQWKVAVACPSCVARTASTTTPARTLAPRKPQSEVSFVSIA